MRIAVRLVTLMLAGVGLLSLFAVLILGHRSGFTNVVRFPGMTPFTIANFIVTTVGSLVAAIQLWRGKSSGWTTGLIVFGIDLLFQTAGLVTFLRPGVPLSSVALNAAFDLVGIIILGLTWGRRFKVSNFAVQQAGARDARFGC